jgi:hypothetical protein
MTGAAQACLNRQRQPRDGDHPFVHHRTLVERPSCRKVLEEARQELRSDEEPRRQRKARDEGGCGGRKGWHWRHGMALLIDGSPGSDGTDHGRQKGNIVLPYRSMSTAVKKSVLKFGYTRKA